MKATPPNPSNARLALLVRGVVQGVGFRPLVYRLARADHLSGWVRNEADAVRIEIEGPRPRLTEFVEALRRQAPPVRVDAIEVQEIPAEGNGAEPFVIQSSAGQATPRPTVPADLATCPECQAEIRDPQQRRYGYPFTNCTHCGPRWSIITALPYDRPKTSMAGFSMCPQCATEYAEPGDRRFHAQPIACPQCGPALQLLDSQGRPFEGATGCSSAGAENTGATGCLPASAESARLLAETVSALLAGQIVAMKGLGGFQLLVDATQAAAVERLRTRKRRPDKPLALLMRTLADVRLRCAVSDDEAALLQSPEAPIVLLRRRSDAAVGGDIAGAMSARDDFAPAVAPGNPFLGVMLPYTPLHHLLMDALDRPVVCTSGNLSEEPMAVETDEALARLGGIADLFLTHDRPIVRPVDDSVVQIGPAGPMVLRRARGYAPLPQTIAPGGRFTILALGGHLKNTVALALGDQVVLTPHIGDLDNLASVEVHRRAVEDLVDFFRAAPDAVACDLHPDYASTRLAESLAARWDVPLVRVQHHHAHVAAVMAQRQLPGPVVGLAWDGTGYGPDGTVWGGEALVCDDSDQFVRLAHLRSFPLPGGNQAVRQPRRSALGLLFELGEEEAARHAQIWFPPERWQPLVAMLRQRLHAPRTSSMGRLFDAVAAICGLANEVSFEGQAAMALQFAAEETHADAYPLPLAPGTPAVPDWDPMLRAVLADRAAGVTVGQVSARFHNALADLTVAIARRSGCRQVALGGGCFQNVLLARLATERLQAAGFSVHLPSLVPPGDGGIALGQAWIAARRLGGDAHVSGSAR